MLGSCGQNRDKLLNEVATANWQLCSSERLLLVGL